MIKLIYSSLLLIFLIQSCNTNESKVDKAKFGVNSLLQDSIPLELENYSKRALQHLEINKTELQVVLPNIILSQVDVYKELLKQLEIKKIYATSEKEYAEYKINENVKALDSLFAKDIEVNLSYFSLINSLEEENLMYANKFNIPIDSMKSYFDLDKIILSDEVYLKIQELVKDDTQRSEIIEKRDKNDLITNAALIGISIIPGGGAIASLSNNTLKAVSQGLKFAKHGWDAKDKLTPLGQTVYTLSKSMNNSRLSSNVLNVAVNKVGNHDKRLLLASQTFNFSKKGAGLLIGGANLSDDLKSSSIDISKTREYFKSIENKIEGRIGDFSDGILAVHLQNVRELVKYNHKLIQKYRS